MNGREIELKYEWDVLDALKPSEAMEKLISLRLFKVTKPWLASSITRDTYFNAPVNNAQARVRQSFGTLTDGQTKELREFTVKVKDKLTTFNRREENVAVSDTGSAIRGFELLLGNPRIFFTTHEAVLWTEDGLVVSVVRPSFATNKLYLEIEGTSESQVSYYGNLLISMIEVKRETRSMLELAEYYAKAHE